MKKYIDQMKNVFVCMLFCVYKIICCRLFGEMSRHFSELSPSYGTVQEYSKWRVRQNNL
jgi:hypothetical protein